MLAQIPRFATLAALKRVFTSPTPYRPQPCGWLLCLAQPSQLSRQSVASCAQAPPSDGIWHESLRHRIIKSAESARFRYEVDNHKWHDEGTLDKAQKAIGCAAIIDSHSSRNLISRSSPSYAPLALLADIDFKTVSYYALLSRTRPPRRTAISLWHGTL